MCVYDVGSSSQPCVTLRSQKWCSTLTNILMLRASLNQSSTSPSQRLSKFIRYVFAFLYLY